MAIKITFFSALLLSVPVLAATQEAVKFPAELNWSSGEKKSNCFGSLCAKFEDSKKPNMSEKLDKVERRRLTDPFSSNDSDPGNNHSTLNFSLGLSN